jgi:uncharacterized protein YbaR (Trm112 family)
VIDPFLLEILVCPETKANIALAPPELVLALNAAIEKGSLSNRAGKRITERVQAALVRQDNEVAYPVRDGIPVMLVDEQIALRQIR